MPPGHGRTRQWSDILTENNKEVIILVNTHRLQWDIINFIDWISWDKEILIKDAYGKTYILDKVFQTYTDYPPCFCNLYIEDRYLFGLLCKGYLPSGWCDFLCPYRTSCMHKEKMKEIFRRDRTEHKLWLFPKAYNDVGVVDSIQNDFLGNDLFFDESPLSYTYGEIRFTYSSIENFKNFIERKVIGSDKSLYEYWKLIIPILDKMQSIIRLTTIIPESEKYQDLWNVVHTYISNTNTKDLTKFIERIKYTIYNHKLSIPKYGNNLLNTLLAFFEDINRIKIPERVVDRWVISKKDQSISHFVDKSYLIRMNILKSTKIILGGAGKNYEYFFNKLYPEFDDYCVLKMDDFKYELKEAYLYTRGVHPKYNMIDSGTFTKQFYNNARLAKKIIDYITKDELTLIILFKDGVKELYKTIPPKLYPQVKFEWSYNVAGLDIFKDCMDIILYNCPGTPTRTNEVISKMHSFEIERLVYEYRIGEMEQELGRIRPNNFPNLKRLFQLTSVRIPGVENYQEFNCIEDLLLLPYLRENKDKEITSKMIWRDVYNKRLGLKSIQSRLKKLVDEDKIEKEIKSRNVGIYRSKT